MKKKRVLIAASTYPPAFGGSGLESHELYKRLRKRLPIEVTALTQSGRGQPPGTSYHEGIEVVRIDPGLPLLTQFLMVGRMMLRQGPRSFNLLHAKDGLPMVLSACFWARALGIPTIRHITSVRDGPISVRWKEFLFRSTFTRARLVHAKNASVVAMYGSMGIPLERIWMNPYPIDTDRFRLPTAQERAVTRASLGFSDGDVVHFVLGRIHQHKNQLLAVEALSLLPDNYKLILAGPVNEAYLGDIHHFVAEHSLEERVVVLPERQEDPVPLYHAADTYLIPSISEGGPCVMIEALCCGIPVIVNEAIGVRQYVREGENGYNVPLRATAFADAARQLSDLVHHLEWRRTIAEQSVARYGADALDPEYARHIAELLKLKM